MIFVITLTDIIIWSVVGAALLLSLIVAILDAIIKAARKEK